MTLGSTSGTRRSTVPWASSPHRLKRRAPVRSCSKVLEPVLPRKPRPASRVCAARLAATRFPTVRAKGACSEGAGRPMGLGVFGTSWRAWSPATVSDSGVSAQAWRWASTTLSSAELWPPASTSDFPRRRREREQHPLAASRISAAWGALRNPGWGSCALRRSACSPRLRQRQASFSQRRSLVWPLPLLLRGRTRRAMTFLLYLTPSSLRARYPRPLLACILLLLLLHHHHPEVEIASHERDARETERGRIHMTMINTAGMACSLL